MARQFTRGIKGQLEKQVANIESFLAGFGRERIVTKNPLGLDVAIEVIGRRITGGEDFTSPHPFKIEVVNVGTVPWLYVNYGAAACLAWDGDSVNKWPVLSEIPLKFAAGQPLLNDPFDSATAGHHVLEAGKTYGVWLSMSGSFETQTYYAGSGTDFTYVEQLTFKDALSEVLISEDHTTPSSPLDKDSNKVVRFIGQVAIDAAGVVTIKQHLRSDITIPLSDLPRGII